MTKLIEKRNALFAEAQALVDAAQNEQRVFTDEEKTTYQSKVTEIRSLDEQINAENELRKLELSKNQDQKPAPVGNEREAAEIRAFEAFICGNTETRDATPVNMTFGANGAIVPETIVNKIIDRVVDISPIFASATKYQIKGTITIPKVDRSGGDIVVAFTPEFSTLTSNTFAFSSISLGGHTAATLVKISKQLINNGQFDVVGVVINKMAEALAIFIENFLINGDSNIQNSGMKGSMDSGNILSVASVAAITGATGSELEALEETAKKYGATTKFSATETAQALKYMGLAGWDAKTSMEALPGILNLAAASGMDLAAASDMVTDYLTAFGLSAEKAAYMADLLTYAQSNSNTSAVQLGQAWGNCAANLHAAGQDIETVTAMLESMANQGLKGSEAGTALAAIMRDITSNMNDGKIAIGNMLISVTDAYGNFRDLTDIMADVEKAVAGMGSAERTAALDATFTARSLKGVNLILEEGSEAVSGYENDLRQSMGSAEKAAGTMSDNLAGDLKTLESGLESLKISIFEDAESPLRDLVHFITDEGIPALKWLYENIEDITEIFAPFAEGINSLLAMPKTSQRELKQTISRESEIVAEIAELDELIRKAEERAAHDRTGSTSTEYIDQLKAEKAALQDRLEKLKSEEEQLKTTQKAVVNLTESEKANTITVKENSEAVDDYTKKSGDLEKYLSTLSDSYKKLDNGQEISLSTILSLIDKYPEYARQLMDIVSGTTAECVEHYLDNNMISPVDTERTMPHFTFLSSSAAGIQNDSYMSRLEDLEMVVEDLCSNAKLGYRIYGRAANNWDDYVFRLLQGTDRSVEQSSNPVVILSGVFQNIVGANFTHSVNNYYNAAYATGANDITQTVYRDSNTPVGYSRRETAIDVGDVGVSDIRQYALYQLRDNIAVSSVSVNICEGIYGSKFTLGDTVTAQDDLTGNLFTGVVTEVQKSISGTAQKTSITLGSGSQKLLNRIVTGIYNGTIRRR